MKHMRMLVAGLGIGMLVLTAGCSFLDLPSAVKSSIEVRGRVTLEGETDHSGVTVRIVYWDCNASTDVVTAIAQTESNGRFRFEGVPIVPEQVYYDVEAYKDGYAYADESFEIHYGYDGSPFEFNSMVLHSQKQMSIAWKYSAIGAFGGVATNQASVRSYARNSGYMYGFDFDKGINSSSYYNAEFRFYDDEDYDHCIWIRYRSIWDLGPVELSSVTTIPTRPSDDSYGYFSIESGHTYLIECDLGYAVFRVATLGPVK